MEDNYQQQLRKGMLVLAILQLLSKKEVYVADMLVALEATEFATQEGTLYPLLARLKREGLVEHTWVESPAGPPRTGSTPAARSRKRRRCRTRTSRWRTRWSTGRARRSG